MTERLDFIRKIKNEKGMKEILTMEQGMKEGIIEIGNNVKIKENAVIGTDGFGFERNEKDEFEKFPHYGKVIIGNDVHIGAFVTIDRGNLNDTIIGDGTKIDNHVHIGHNAQIGKHCLIVAGSVIGGSSIIGDYTELNMSVLIRPHIKIGTHCIIGMGSVVTKNIPNNSIVYGNPGEVKKGKIN